MGSRGGAARTERKLESAKENFAKRVIKKKEEVATK
jgi:hypothetical protein